MKSKEAVYKKIKLYENMLNKNTYKRAESILYEILESEEFSEKFTLHAQRIFTTIAIYRALIEEMGEKDSALKFTAELFHLKWSFPARKQLNLFMKIPYFYRIFPDLAKRMVLKSYNEDSGFEAGESHYQKGDFFYKVIHCPYYEYCKKYGHPELTDIFCVSDEICYLNLHKNLKFERHKTIGRGDEYCDFHYYIKDDKD